LLWKNYEVLLLDDPIDEFTLQALEHYGGKKLINVGLGSFRFPDEDNIDKKRMKKLTKIFKPLTNYFKKFFSNDV